MKINKRDLLNMLRHAYLMGANTGMFTKDTQSEDEFIVDRESAIKELIESQKQNKRTCYNEYPCNCPHTEKTVSKPATLIYKNSSGQRADSQCDLDGGG